MARYLIVAHQTAASEELIERVRFLASEDPSSEFVLLVPATPIEHLLTWSEGESRALASRDAETARAALEAAGVNVVRADVGDSSPLMAIQDELSEHQGACDAMVISTFPPGLSRWLKLDLPHQAERKFKLPVIHVIAERRGPAEQRPPSAL